MTKTRVGFNMVARGMMWGVIAGVITGVVLGFPLMIVGSLYGAYFGAMIGAGVGAFNGICLAIVHMTVYYPADRIADTKKYQNSLMRWMAVLTAIACLAGIQILFGTLEFDVYLVWMAPLFGAILALPITRRLTNWYMDVFGKKKRA